MFLSFMVISLDVDLEISSVLTKFSSSTGEFLHSTNSYSMSFSKFTILFLYSDNFSMFSFLEASTYGFSNFITSANSWSSSPFWFTVKLITLDLINISGSRFGLDIFVVQNNLKSWWYSTSSFPKAISILLSSGLIYYYHDIKGSSNDSNELPRSSNNKVIPLTTAIFIFSYNFRLSFSDVKTTKFSVKVFLIQVFAYSCGSIIKGHFLLKTDSKAED